MPVSVVKHKKPNLTKKASITPAIYWTKDSEKQWKSLQHMFKQRVKEGARLMLLSLGHELLESIQKRAPKIMGQEYARDLRLAWVNGIHGTQAIAVIYGEKMERVKEGEGATSLFYVRKKRKAPDYISVMMEYNPWVASLFPKQFDGKHATMVVKEVPGDDVKKREKAIDGLLPEIDRKLRAAGLKGEIFGTKEERELVAAKDVGVEVLRYEFGLGAPKKMHWRNAIRLLKKRGTEEDLKKKFLAYLRDGDATVFGDKVNEDIDVGDFKVGIWFQEKVK